jgi:LysM repeat protein
MRARTWAIVIAINVVISATVMLITLFVWEHIRNSASLAPLSTSMPPTTEDTAGLSAMTQTPHPGPAEPIQYTVQSGDTLGGIAQTYDVSIEDLMTVNGITDPNLLQVGQILIIPSGPLPTPITDLPTQTPPAGEVIPTLLPTLTPSGPTMVEIGQVLGSDDLASEVVVIRNLGGAVSLEGWTLSDAEGNVFTFPAITLFADVQMRVHSTPGRSTPSDLYWGRETPAWNGGELITLRDRAGNVTDTYIVP